MCLKKPKYVGGDVLTSQIKLKKSFLGKGGGK